MEPNTNRAPTEARPPSAGPELIGPTQLPPRPPLLRTDSRNSFQPQGPRPNLPPQIQQRPQFQPGGPVTNPPQYAPRPGPPLPRGPAPTGPPGPPQTRPPPLRPGGPQQFVPQQGPRPLQSPTSGQPPQRVPPPNNLQFGPRQPPQFGGATTSEGSRPLSVQQPNGVPRNGVPGQILRQPSQGSLKGPDPSNLQNKPINLENQNLDYQKTIKPENGSDASGMAKARSFSIAAAPGAPSPLKMEADRRTSVSAIGGRTDEFTGRAPGLGLIQEKIDSKDNIRGSKESVRSVASTEGRDDPERPESRLAGSKMSESFIGSLSSSTPKKKFDDNDDVVLQSNVKNGSDGTQNPRDMSERSPSLTRSDDSPEMKQNNVANPVLVTKPQNILSKPNLQESQRPKMPKIEPELELKEAKPVALNKTPPKSPLQDSKPPMSAYKKPSELNTSAMSAKSTPKRASTAPKSRPKDGDNDSGVDESTQGNDLNGSPGSPNKKVPSKLPTKEKSSNSIKTSLSRSSSKSATAKTPETPQPSEKKKVPMNKVQVGNAPSPNIKAVKSKIGSLENATYKPGGGKVKIENRKLEFGNVTPRIAAKNDNYAPSGGVKKIPTAKLEWNAKSKIGSLQNTSYKPGGGDKKIETVKLDFKEKAKPKIASTANLHHKPGGGAIKIENQKLEFKAQSKIGSLDNVKHKPGGGDIKIFDDKDYIKQMTGTPAPGSRSLSRQESPVPPAAHPSKTEKDENLNQQPC
ncbi:hypothetical protein O0L34_g17282 [Tuta absoluta]|nr:hypothetical protein O0L34_g17282 [Tuta absoluta]